MSITNELREWWVREFPVMDKELHQDFVGIADRIDAEHEKALRELNDYASASILLPKDADGMLIHIGDKMERIELGYVCEVIAVDVNCFIAWNTYLDRYCQYDSKLFRHHHEPTVEDVLREFALDIDPSADVDISGKPIIERFAAKLQLKEPSQ